MKNSKQNVLIDMIIENAIENGNYHHTYTVNLLSALNLSQSEIRDALLRIKEA